MQNQGRRAEQQSVDSQRLRAGGGKEGYAESLWSVSDVSTYLGVPVATLYQWRHRGEGPAAYRVGRHLRYEPAGVKAWLLKQVA